MPIKFSPTAIYVSINSGILFSNNFKYSLLIEITSIKLSVIFIDIKK